MLGAGQRLLARTEVFTFRERRSSRSVRTRPTPSTYPNTYNFGYHKVMATAAHREILPTTVARAKLSQIAAEFELHGASAEPVTFGSHRRPQGVIIAWELWLEILPAIEDHLDASEARQRLNDAGSDRLSFDAVAKALGRDPRRHR